MQNILISVAWPYANGDLHLGHLAGCLLPATIFNDYHRLRGNNVIMVSGSDMHGTPVAVKAWKEGLEPHKYAYGQHVRHVEFLELLGMDYSLYTTTATELHKRVVQLLFSTLVKAGFIFKKKTAQFWSAKEKKFLLDRYVEGKCPICGFEKARGDQCDNCGNTLTPEELINPYSIFGDATLEKKESTNYYLDLPKLQPYLEDLFKNHPNLENWRKHVWSTTEGWLKNGLEARAITRDMEGYGVPLPAEYDIPDEPGKVIYVWFEAVSGYLTAAIELAKKTNTTGAYKSKVENEFTQAVDEVINQIKKEEESSDVDDADSVRQIFKPLQGQKVKWEDFWLNGQTKAYNFIGKDNIPFHTVIWPAMLQGLNVSFKYPTHIAPANIDSQATSTVQFTLPWDVPANQFLNLRGGKFSKSTGNMIYARYLLENYNTDAVRYYLTSRMPENKDYDFSWEEFVEANNNELVANFGNFVNRTLAFWNKFPEIWRRELGVGNVLGFDKNLSDSCERTFARVAELIEGCHFGDALAEIMLLSTEANKYFNDQEIWQLVKSDTKKAAQVMFNLLQLVAALGRLASPFLPKAAALIGNYLQIDKLEGQLGLDNWDFPEINAPTLAEQGEITGLTTLFPKLDWKEVQVKENLA